MNSITHIVALSNPYLLLTSLLSFRPNRVLWVHCLMVPACRAAFTSADPLIRHPSEISRYPAAFRLIPCGEAIRPNSIGPVAAGKIRKTRNKCAALCSSPRPLWSCWPFWASLPWPPILEVTNSMLPDCLVPFLLSVSYYYSRFNQEQQI